MPVSPIIQKDSLDRFYTREDVAKECVDILFKLIPNTGTLFIEPSAGEGVFLELLPKESRIGLDVYPAHPEVIEHNWFDFNVPDGECVVVGNPPFGSRNTLSKKFIKRAMKFTKTIAFVLPDSYNKKTTQDIFPDNWKLIRSHKLPKNSFVFEGSEYHVPCVFQIWSCDSIFDNMENLRESVKPVLFTDDFSFVKAGEGDFFCFGASPSKMIDPDKVSSSNRGYYVETHNPWVVEKFKEIDWKSKGNSSVSGGVAWFTKQEIINHYVEFQK